MAEIIWVIHNGTKPIEDYDTAKEARERLEQLGDGHTATPMLVISDGRRIPLLNPPAILTDSDKVWIQELRNGLKYGEPKAVSKRTADWLVSTGMGQLIENKANKN